MQFLTEFMLFLEEFKLRGFVCTSEKASIIVIQMKFRIKNAVWEGHISIRIMVVFFIIEVPGLLSLSTLQNRACSSNNYKDACSFQVSLLS